MITALLSAGVVDAPNSSSWDPNTRNLPLCPELDGIDPDWFAQIIQTHPSLVKPYEKFTQLKTEFWPPKFIALSKSFHKDLAYLAKHTEDVFYEKMFLNFLRNHANIIESHLQMSWIFPDTVKKIEGIFRDLSKTFQSKSLRITTEGEGLYGRMIPRLDIVPKEIPFGTDLSDQRACYRETKSIEHKQEADYLVEVLSQIDELSSRYKIEDCDARANLIFQLLLYMGVPRKDMEKVMLYPPKAMKWLSWTSEDWTEDHIPWNYHVGIVITTKNKEQLVIDPSADPKQALSLDDWGALFDLKKDSHDIEFWQGNCSNCYQNSYSELYLNRLLADVPYKSALRTLIRKAFAASGTIRR